MGSMPIGQAEAVTGLQIADAYNLIANGGRFVPPRLVKAIVGPGGKRHAPPAPAAHRVLSARVDHQLLSMLGSVVGQHGTAPKAAVPGYVVAGKTGTAQVPSKHGGYIPGAFMATFVGVVPAKHPALTILVTLDRPAGPNYFGGSVAAPVFSKIASDALVLLHSPPPRLAGQPARGGLPAQPGKDRAPSRPSQRPAAPPPTPSSTLSPSMSSGTG
jgi:cell division protein FtsI/penicillin-binding protein 2